MDIKGKVAVVTGAASGIGRALAARFARDGAKGVVLGDVQVRLLEEVAGEIGGLAVTTDVAREADIKNLIARAESAFGPVDIFVSNAGVYRPGSEAASDADWALNWNVHVLAHVYAARDLMPKMTARGSGYFLITASSAGLLTHINSATYAVTKHGAVGLAEYLAIAHGQAGVRVSVLCPQAVRTAMTQGRETAVSSIDGMLDCETVADCVVAALTDERFLILPHPEVLEYFRRKASDYDRWLSGMRRLKARFPES